MKCAIMQPTYMPWAGYFNLIASVDTFVFLDDVQFDRRSWQSRNRIFDGGKVAWLSCPVKKAPRDTLIKDLTLATDVNWQNTHAKKIQLNYAKAPFYDDLQGVLDTLLTGEYLYLSQVNQALIGTICKLLGIHTACMTASQINAKGKRSEHLLSICKQLACTQYLSPQGSKAYLTQDDSFTHSGVELAFQNYDPAPYLQKHSGEYISHLSIIDVIANIGISKTKAYITG